MGIRRQVMKAGQAMAQFVGSGINGDGSGNSNNNATVTAKDKDNQRRGSMLNRLMGSPGRGEPHGYSTKVEKIKRRRARGAGGRAERRQDKRYGISESDSQSEEGKGGRRKGRRDKDSTSTSATNNSTNNTKNTKSSLFSTVFSVIETHPNLPHILSFYAQLALNLFLVFSFISILWSFWATIRADVDKKSEEAIAETLADMAVCVKNYRENRCEPESRVPAMESVCGNWERCMNRDPTSVGRARVSVHTFAEIFNSFVEPISYKAMIFTLLLVFGSIFISNAAFSFFRKKELDLLTHYSSAYYAAHLNQHPQYLSGPPATPHRLHSGFGLLEQSRYDQSFQQNHDDEITTKSMSNAKSRIENAKNEKKF